MLPRLAWWDANDQASFVRIIQATLQMRDHPYMAVFRKRLEIVAVFMANKIERTIPVTFSECVGVLEQIQNDPDFAAGDVRWPSEGSNSRECVRQQLFQHAQALFYIIQRAYHGDPLTPEFIRELHGILMFNSLDDNGRLLRSGSFRTGPAHNGAGFVYAEAESIDSEINELCDSVRSMSASEVHEQCALVARFMYRFLVIHPFENGNGRLARLLVNYCFLVMGAPFVIPLTNGHSKARKHYMACIQNESRGKTGHLASHLLECYANACHNFHLLI